MASRKTILQAVVVFLLSCPCAARPQSKPTQRPAAKPANLESGKQMYLKYCASCHGKEGKGDGPAAWAMNTPPTDLTTLAKRNAGKFPWGYVGAILKFGKSFASHGSEDMPIWGQRFKELDPTRDPTGDQHVKDLVAYIASQQVK